MMLRHLAFLGALSVAVAAVVACGSSDASGTGATSQAVTTNFDGVYVPTTAGAIGSIAFSHGRDYLLLPTGCNAQGCSEIGTYKIDSAQSSIVLTSSAGSSHSLSLKVLATQKKEATVAKTQSAAGSALSVRDLINTDSGSLIGASDAGSLVALVQALINAITQADVGGQDMSQLGGNDAGAGDDGSDDDSDDAIQDAGARIASPCTDAGTDGGVCSWVAACSQNVPTTTSTVAEINAYWARCPVGPVSYYYAH